jgi:hypothetical protein
MSNTPARPRSEPGIGLATAPGGVKSYWGMSPSPAMTSTAKLSGKNILSANFRVYDGSVQEVAAKLG